MRKICLALFAAISFTATSSFAQQAPVPPLIKLVVPFSPGGSTDVIARSLATHLGKRLGTNVIVENRPGAGSLIGAVAVSKAPPDGSMLLLGTGSLVTSAATNPAVPFNFGKDLIPVALIGDNPMVVAVSTKTSIKSPSELVAAARAKPDGLTYGSSGVGSIAHLTAELINDSANIRIKHIPYKGTSQALVDLASGTIDMTVGIYTSLASQIQAGNVRLIGVTSKEANPAYPGVLPMDTAVPGLVATTWAIVFAPPGTPSALIQRLNHEINEVAKTREVADQMRADGGSARALTPQQTGQLANESYELWKRIAVAKKISVQ